MLDQCGQAPSVNDAQLATFPRLAADVIALLNRCRNSRFQRTVLTVPSPCASGGRWVYEGRHSRLDDAKMA